MSNTELKRIKGRISHKHGTEEHWFTAGTAENPFIPLEGELIIYDPDDIYDTRTKYGDGVTPVHLLPWATGCNESVGLSYVYLKPAKYYDVNGIGNCTDSNIIVPKGHQGLPVTNIYSYVFRDSSLTSIVIPNSVTSIGNGAFYGCDSLTSVTIPDSVTSIGKEAFANCKSLKSITIPNSVTSIGVDAFVACSSLTIYCKADSKPSGWHEGWNSTNCPVVWGFVDDFIGVNGKIAAGFEPINNHLYNYDNPHEVTAEQIGALPIIDFAFDSETPYSELYAALPQDGRALVRLSGMRNGLYYVHAESYRGYWPLMIESFPNGVPKRFFIDNDSALLSNYLAYGVEASLGLENAKYNAEAIIDTNDGYDTIAGIVNAAQEQLGHKIGSGYDIIFIKHGGQLYQMKYRLYGSTTAWLEIYNLIAGTYYTDTNNIDVVAGYSFSSKVLEMGFGGDFVPPAITTVTDAICDLYEQIGNVSTALDSAISLTDSIIGGNS